MEFKLFCVKNPDETRIDGTEAKQTALTLKFGKIVAK
jgi:hypothetical protein